MSPLFRLGDDHLSGDRRGSVPTRQDYLTSRAMGHASVTRISFTALG